MHRSHRRIKVSSQELSCSSPLLRSTANILDGWHGQRWYCISVNDIRERERDREREFAFSKSFSRPFSYQFSLKLQNVRIKAVYSLLLFLVLNDKIHFMVAIGGLEIYKSKL